MDSISIYILVGMCIIVGSIILVLLKRDNAKQEKMIEKYTRDITLIKNDRKKI